MNVPITKPTIGKEEVEVVKNVVSSGFLVKGKNTEEIEKSLASYCKRKYSVMLTSGTISLNTSLMALGIGKGDEVIVPAFTFVATATAVPYVGAKIVFADIDPVSFNIDPKDVEKRITRKTKAIIAVDLFGNPFNYTALSKIARKHKLILIEDAAQAHGASFKNKKTGSLGDISIFSFYGSKIITSGEGGMLLTDKEQYYKKAFLYRNHGEEKDVDRKYFFTTLGYNFMPTDLQGALLLEQFKKLDKFVKLRNKVAKYYTQKLKNIDGVTCPSTSAGNTHAYSCFTIRLDSKKFKRDEILEKLNANGVGARVYYPVPLHMQPVWEALGYKFKKGGYPNAELASREVLSLPMYPMINREEQDYVIAQLKAALN